MDAAQIEAAIRRWVETPNNRRYRVTLNEREVRSMAEDLAEAFQLAERVLIGTVDRLQAVINEAWRGYSGGHGGRGGGGQRPREPGPIDHDPGLLTAVMALPDEGTNYG